jgi:hypothetical protein
MNMISIHTVLALDGHDRFDRMDGHDSIKSMAMMASIERQLTRRRNGKVTGPVKSNTSRVETCECG